MSAIRAHLEPDPEAGNQLKLVPAKTTNLLDRIAKATSTVVAKTYLPEPDAFAAKETDHTKDRLRSLLTFDSENI